MLISASYFSYDRDRKSYVQKLINRGIQLLHIDYREEMAEISQLQEIKEIEGVLFDVHMICSDIKNRDIDFFNSISAMYLCYEYENLDKPINLDVLKQFKGKIGLAFTMETGIDIIYQFVDKIDFVLIMCTSPGISGQKFDYQNIDRIRRLRKDFPELEIHVDGGIDNEKAVLLSHLNVALIVTGSYLANADGGTLIDRVFQLKYSNSDTVVGEIMIPINVLSQISIDDNFQKVVEALNNDKLSIITVFDGEEPIGIITDGDVRRELLTYGIDSFNHKAESMVNRNPITIEYNYLVKNLMLDKIILNYKMLAVPVVFNKKIVGMIELNTLG